jgi:hypothetical protein
MPGTAGSTKEEALHGSLPDFLCSGAEKQQIVVMCAAYEK